MIRAFAVLVTLGSVFYFAFADQIATTSSQPAAVSQDAFDSYISDSKKVAADLSVLIDRPHRNFAESIPTEIGARIRKINSVCLEGGRLDQLMKFLDDQYRTGNSAPLIGFLAQRFRLTPAAADLERKFNVDCKTSDCRSKLLKEMKAGVADSRAFDMMYVMQLYPRVIHLENMPGLTRTDAAGPPPVTKFTQDGNPIWRDLSSVRAFPEKNMDGVYQNDGNLYSNGKRYINYGFCNDGLETSYNPNIWLKDGGDGFLDSHVGEFKTYLDCHGRPPGFLCTAVKCKSYTPPSECDEIGRVKIQDKFDLTDTEKNCYEMRLFNPKRPSS